MGQAADSGVVGAAHWLPSGSKLPALEHCTSPVHGTLNSVKKVWYQRMMHTTHKYRNVYEEDSIHCVYRQQKKQLQPVIPQARTPLRQVHTVLSRLLSNMYIHEFYILLHIDEYVIFSLRIYGLVYEIQKL